MGARESNRQYMRRYRAVHGSTPADDAYVARWGSRAINLAKNAGIPVCAAAAALASMPDACVICGADDVDLVYDHDHFTENHRGWLCHDCNLGLGYFSDSPELLRAAAVYLED